MFRTITTLTVTAAMLALAVGCSNYKESGGDATAAPEPTLEEKAAATVKAFKTQDPSMSKFFDSASGWAVFPTVGKGAIGIGGAYGKGVLYEGGRVVGYTSLSQGTIGFQLGGQAYSEIIFFKGDQAVEDFKRGNMEFSAQASAVAATAGASADADFEGGVAVFTMAKGGLMFEASIGGQKFTYEDK